MQLISETTEIKGSLFSFMLISELIADALKILVVAEGGRQKFCPSSFYGAWQNTGLLYLCYKQTNIAFYKSTCMNQSGIDEYLLTFR